MYLAGKRIDVVNIKHIANKNYPFFNRFLVKTFNLHLFPIFIQIAYLFKGELPVIRIHHKLLS
jgi:hypothetical protein